MLTGSRFFHHRSGDVYEIIGRGLDEATLRPVIMYRRVDEDAPDSHPIWIRPVEDFLDYVAIESGTMVRRFIDLPEVAFAPGDGNA